MADRIDRDLADFLQAEFAATVQAIAADLEQDIQRLRERGGPSREAIADAVRRATIRVRAAEARALASLEKLPSS